MLRTYALALLCCGFILAAFSIRAADNELTEQEQKDGWKLLFDGKEVKGWKNRFKDTAGGWVAENGELICKKPGSGDVVYMDEKFENFQLSIDWKIAPKGNSGVFIRTSDLKDWINTGMEIQVLDERELGERNHPSKSHAAGSLYDVVPRPEDMKMKEDDWNHFDIVCNNEKISCKMNGVESFSIDLKDEKWQKPQGKFKKPYATLPRLGYLMLQDHHAVVAFKNIKIKVLPPPPDAK